MVFCDTRLAARLVKQLALCCVLVVCGCSSDPEKSSLFDHDHDVPDHWPENLGDTTVKIRERLERLDTPDSPAAKELVDLVSWTPEFAADTSMSETQWNPIYEASESLRLRLEKGNFEWNDESREEAEELCVLIDAAWDQLPEEEKHATRIQGHSHDHEHDHDHGHDDGHGAEHGHDHDADHDHDHGHEHDHDADHDDHHDHADGHDEDHEHPHDHEKETEDAHSQSVPGEQAEERVES